MNVFACRPLLAVAAALAFALAAAPAAAAGSGHDGHSHGHQIDFGEPGKASEATRTIEVVMYDNYFEPESISVQSGEVIRFVVRNEGDFLHEFNLGTAVMHAAHQKEMAAMQEHGMLTPTGIDHEMMNMDHSKAGMPDMKHDDPNSVLVEPGQTAELVWKFTDPSNLEFACNVPGHYDSGMVGDVKFQQ
jgi:uncharacterized cupredoxin-like copper-binding protein